MFLRRSFQRQSSTCRTSDINSFYVTKDLSITLTPITLLLCIIFTWYCNETDISPVMVFYRFSTKEAKKRAKRGKRLKVQLFLEHSSVFPLWGNIVLFPLSLSSFSELHWVTAGIFSPFICIVVLQRCGIFNTSGVIFLAFTLLIIKVLMMLKCGKKWKRTECGKQERNNVSSHDFYFLFSCFGKNIYIFTSYIFREQCFGNISCILTSSGG